MHADLEGKIRRGAPSAARPFVAVAVMRDRRHAQWHAGLAYGDEQARVPRFLHLAWDRALLDQGLDDEELGWEQAYAWIELPVPSEKARALVQLCRRIAARVQADGQQVRFAIRHVLGRFDATTGIYMPAARERGLTCATCVMAVCRGVEVELVDVASWPSRAEDQAWIDTVIALLRRTDPELADAIAEDGLCARFRPTEVTGACLVPPLKVLFVDAVQSAALVVQRYEALFPAVAG